ncbi:hypothetical protein KTH02_01685 [Acinetobacter radioresistens]|uniref:hypothetical protein n=1 Tax=Acinetobacter radioresistens TaxID=40216 RepID=UPI0021CD3706|nr:hypothetical protein [Acinetobacter radioresistens]MCU4307585.1 hypothetical protein [Acinetobacter radioresistens]
MAEDLKTSVENFNTDAQTAEEVVNGNESGEVTARLGRKYPTLPAAIEKIMKAGGYFDSYATLAEANAKVAEIPLNRLVRVLSATDGGDYYKASADATSLTKSPWDPVAQAKADATTKANAAQAAAITAAATDATTKANAAEANAKIFAKDITEVFDSSKVSGNYNLTFDQAVALIPDDLKKRFLTLKYNNSEVRTYINTDLTTNWTNQRFWIRPTNTMAEGKINHVDERMIYRGFTIGTLSNITVDPKNACMIIPIHRTYTDGVENKLNIAAYPVTIIPVSWGFLRANGTTTTGGGTNLAQLLNATIPSDAKYVYINLEVNNATTGVVTGLGNVEIASKYLRYTPDNSNTATLAEPLSSPDGFNRIEYGVPSAISIDRTKGEARAITPYFKSGLGTVKGLHISQIVKHVEIQKGHNSLINKLTGLPRRFIITAVKKSANGYVEVLVSSETEDGVLQPAINAFTLPDADGYVRIEWVRSQDTDPVKVRAVIDPSQIAVETLTFGDAGEIHPSIVEKANKVANVNKGVAITDYIDCGVSRVSSNMALPAAQPLTLTRRMVNGFLYNEASGSAANDHQQTTLTALKTSRASGIAGIYIEALASYANNPKVDIIRDTSSVPFGAGNSAGRGILGQTMDSQWVHPDMCYAPDGVGGFKYWMVNSNFTNGSDRKEDADLLVSNDGVTWKRIRGFYESDNGGLPLKNPEVFWNSSYKNTFMPIPNSGSFEFALESTTETKTITGYLNHDPAISYHNGYVNVYILYNLGFVNTSFDHKYVVCFRTNDGVNWEIVREDGSIMPYNEANAMLIFTKTNGVRNHICFKYSASGVGGLDLSPQVVKVTDTEWYYYARTGSSNLNLVRYAGTSPYTFDFNNPQSVSKNNANGGSLWHFGIRHYGGVFYLMMNGFMFTSTDGLNFTTTTYPFFWRGMSSDIYKPTFVVGHDGKVKMAYGIQCLTSVPHPYAQQVAVSPVPLNKLFVAAKITATLVCQYNSLADIMNRSTNATADAYVDVIVAVISQRTKSVQFRLLPCLRAYTELLNSVDISFDDEIYVAAYLNTRNGGSLNFGGVSLTLPDAVTN